MMWRWHLFLLSMVVFLYSPSLSNCDNGASIIPINLSSPKQTYSSIDLDWEVGFANNDSADYENDIPESPTTFIIVFSPPATANCGCCIQGRANMDTCVTNRTSISVTGLMFRVNYTFTVYANSTEAELANTDEYSSSVSVLTPGNVPPSFSNVNLCLHYEGLNKQTQLISHVMPCPLYILDPDTTPPVIGYELQVSGLPADMIKSNLCAGHSINVTEKRSYTVRATAVNKVGQGDTAVSKKFHASWLRNISVKHMNDTLRVHYDTASCVVNKGLKIHLSLSAGHFSSINYNSDDKVFVIDNIKQGTPLLITLQVVDAQGKDVGTKHIIGHNQPTHKPPTTGTSTVAVPTGKAEEGLSLHSMRLIIGIVAGMTLFLILLLISMFFVLRKLSKTIQDRFKVEKEEFEYLSPKPRQDNSTEPSTTSPSLSLTLSDVYEDMEIHKQNPACVWVPDHEEVVTNPSHTSVL